ncbi:MAG: hypothetical protein R8J85_08530 [Mariprofundales bacterium]
MFNREFINGSYYPFTVRCMYWSRSIRLFVARLLTALFALQVVAAGFCLLVPQAHAMTKMDIAPVAQLDADAPCENNRLHADDNHAHGGAGCFHCVTPDLAKVFSVENPLQPQMVALLFVVTGVGEAVAAAPVFKWKLHDPGGSAGNHSLLFHLIPRILV